MKYEYRSTTNRRSYFLLTGERTALALGKGILTLSFIFFKTLSPPTVRMFFCFYFFRILILATFDIPSFTKMYGEGGAEIVGFKGT